MSLNGQSVRFGEFELLLKSAELLCNDRKVKLPEQPFQVLLALIEHPGEVVTRDELRQRLWPTDVYVDYERSLNAAVKRLREVLGDQADAPRFIETLPKHGYRFIATVSDAPEPKELHPNRRSGWILRSAIVAVLIAAALLSVGALWKRYTAPKIHSLVVLPLKNLSNDPKQDYFADGITEALISDLSQVESLRVISRTSSMQFKNTTKPLPKIAEELDVDGVVEGSVLREGDRVRIITRLVQVRSDRPIWSETYDRDVRDLLTLQTEVAGDIAGRIQLKLAVRNGNQRRVDPEVQQAYMQARYYMNRVDPPKTLEAFERAIAKDPQFAPGYAGAAYSLALAPPAQNQMPRAKALAQKALELDDSLAEAHAAMGTVYFVNEWNWAAAEKELTRALQLDPSSVMVRMQYAYLLVATGRVEAALAEVRQAQRIDPFSLLANVNYARMLYYNRRYDEAIEQFNQTLALDPRYPPAYCMRSMAMLKTGHDDQAVADIRASWALTQNENGLRALQQNPHRGVSETLKLIAKYDATKPDAPGDSMLYAQAGDIDKAFELLEAGFRTHDRTMVYLKSDPIFDNLRSDPRYKDLLRRMNLPQ